MALNSSYKAFEKKLEQYKALNLDHDVNYELMNEILISHHSTAIEGSTLTEAESRMLILDGLTAKGKPLAHHLMMQDHYNALTEIVKLAKEKNAISPEFIQKINSCVLKQTGGIVNTVLGNFDSSKGDWRKVNVHAGTRRFVNFDKIETMVKTLCDDVQERTTNAKIIKEIYDLAFDAHFNLVSIHPFVDGNGRTSRLLMNYVLAYHKQPLAIVFKEDRLDYINALEQSRTQETTEPFKLFMYEQQQKFFQQEIQKCK